MNFEQALLWTALTVMIGIFVFTFYALIKAHRDDNDGPDDNYKKTKGRKPLPPTPASRNTIAKEARVGSGIFSPISRISNSKVEVNITNYPPEPESTKEQHLDNSRMITSLTGNPAETEKRSSPCKKRKEPQE